MSFKFECPNCGQHISAAASDIGITAPCPHCSQAITVPNPLSAAPAPSDPFQPAPSASPSALPTITQRSAAPPPVFGVLSIVLPAFAILLGTICAADAAAHTSGFSLFPGLANLVIGAVTAGILYLIFGVAALARKERKRWLVGPSPVILVALLVVGGILYNSAERGRHSNSSVPQQAINSAPPSIPNAASPAFDPNRE
jgi:hypothetical protein